MESSLADIAIQHLYDEMRKDVELIEEDFQRLVPDLKVLELKKATTYTSTNPNGANINEAEVEYIIRMVNDIFKGVHRASCYQRDGMNFISALDHKVTEHLQMI